MANIKFFYNNLWNDETMAETTQHANFPSENTQNRDLNEPWRTLYGASSGWGSFKITLNSNDKLYFDDNGAVARTATLTAGTYDADELAAEIETQMEAQTADTFTVEYLEAGSDKNKFKITDDAGVFELTLSSTTNAVWDTIGFTDPDNLTGAANYTADEIRIHSLEQIYFLRNSTISINGAIIRGHNFQAAATISLLGSDDNLATAPLSDSFTVQDNIMILEYDTAETYQDWAIRIKDIDNPDTYAEMGVVFLGPQFQPTINYLSKSRVTKKVDPSIIKRSEAGQISTIQLDDYEVWQYSFRVVGSTQKGYFDTMLAAVKKSLPLFICEDPDSPLTTTYYCQFVDWEWTPVYEVSDVWDLMLQVEELT